MYKFYREFSKSSYGLVSKNSFFETYKDKGNIGEFYTFSKLKELDRRNKILTNVYLKKEDGSTTEVDVVMISTKGIYVFESKNYSGWIYGSERNKQWTQTFQNKKKQSFFNPIWQNKLHIKELSRTLDVVDIDVFVSYIVFSERCTLKKVQVLSSNTFVIKRNQLLDHIKKLLSEKPDVFTYEETEAIFQRLLNNRVLDEQRKENHISHLRSSSFKIFLKISNLLIVLK